MDRNMIVLHISVADTPRLVTQKLIIHISVEYMHNTLDQLHQIL